ncbi:MAG: DUF1080 domain-containing protein [Bacteroidota bacterium]|jgi:hypothetical protein|nr:DUF1080 domain-containing protein [Bacteroidota bacterium]HHU96243.1 DUF1080 domain-containing protein [Petrimonas sp.]
MKQAIFSTLLALLLLSIAGCKQKEEGAIFNGKDLSNWEFVVEDNAVPAEQVFRVENGVIRVMGEPFGYMYTREKYRNFVLELEYRWADGESNSGIFVLIEELLSPFPKAVECQLQAGRAGDFVLLGGANLNEYVLPEGVTERPRFPVIGKQHPSNEKPAGEWNKMRISVNEGIVEVHVNGLLQNRGTSEIKEGHIALQSEGKEIQFKNLSLRES